MPRSYRTLYVPVDNSGHSFAAIDLAVDIAARFEAHVVGSHVAPGGSTACCLDLLEESCRSASIHFERKTLDGRYHRILLEDIAKNHCDLVVMGGLGSGAVDESQIGSVAERVVRGASTDVLVVKDLIPDPEGPILAAVDGSPQSLDALSAALELGRTLGHTVEAIVVGEGHLSGPASTAMHAARRAAAGEGTEVEVTVSEGKPFDRIVKLCREKRPWLLAIGKTGTDGEAGDDLGSTAANLLRLAPCNILVAPGVKTPVAKPHRVAAPAAAQAPPASARRSLRWTEEAERLLEDVPAEQREEVIRTVEEGARKMGVTVITADTIDRVMLGYIDS